MTLNTEGLLVEAAKLIDNEERWTDSLLFNGIDLKNDPLCANVTMCARGALAFAAFGAEAVKGYEDADDAYFDDDDLSDDDILKQFALDGTMAVERLSATKEASDLLDEAAREVAERAGIRNAEEWSVIVLNDTTTLPRAERYKLIRETFALAIEKARGLVAA